MKILFYSWGSVCEPGFIRAIKSSGDICVVFAEKMKDYHADAAFAEKFLQIMHSEAIEAVVSYDYFPLLSMLCEMNGIPYASWIYDCPQYTLYSKTITNTCNYLFCFDAEMALGLQERGGCNVYAFPLGTDVEGFREILDKNSCPGKYAAEISFVGSLYREAYEKIPADKLSAYENGCLEGLKAAQEKLYGFNFVKQVMPEKIVDAVVQAGNLKLGDFYDNDAPQMAADAVNGEISADERAHVLELLAKHWKVTVYSGSKQPEPWKNSNLKWNGYVDYTTQMPEIFRQSRINLNITSKTIHSGIPQRVLDIMACGGFCLTNYQPEIAEFFQDGVELAMYGSMDELVQKVQYYLEHEEERRQVAENGYKRVCEEFALEKRWEIMRGAFAQ